MLQRSFRIAAIRAVRSIFIRGMTVVRDKLAVRPNYANVWFRSVATAIDSADIAVAC